MIPFSSYDTNQNALFSRLSSHAPHLALWKNASSVPCFGLLAPVVLGVLGFLDGVAAFCFGCPRDGEPHAAKAPAPFSGNPLFFAPVSLLSSTPAVRLPSSDDAGTKPFIRLDPAAAPSTCCSSFRRGDEKNASLIGFVFCGVLGRCCALPVFKNTVSSDLSSALQTGDALPLSAVAPAATAAFASCGATFVSGFTPKKDAMLPNN